MAAAEGYDYYSGGAWFDGLEERMLSLMCKVVGITK